MCSSDLRLVTRAMVRALHTARDGRIWVATSAGLQRLDGDRLVTPSAAAAGLREVSSVASDRTGNLWVCDAVAGLVRLGGPALDLSVVAPPRNDEQPSLVRVDDADRAWVALRSGGALMVDRGRITRFPRGQALPHSTIYTVTQDQAGRVWFGGDGGLSLFADGAFHTITHAQGLPEIGRAHV